jgi:hypothetical protein
LLLRQGSDVTDDLLGSPPATFQSCCHGRDAIRRDSTVKGFLDATRIGSDSGNGHFSGDDHMRAGTRAATICPDILVTRLPGQED